MHHSLPGDSSKASPFDQREMLHSAPLHCVLLRYVQHDLGEEEEDWQLDKHPLLGVYWVRSGKVAGQKPSRGKGWPVHKASAFVILA